jgi:hypothetical protein
MQRVRCHHALLLSIDFRRFRPVSADAVLIPADFRRSPISSRLTITLGGLVGDFNPRKPADEIRITAQDAHDCFRKALNLIVLSKKEFY